MKQNTLDLKDISDSRELMEAKTHPFITFFLAILTTIILIAAVWSYFGKIDIVAKGQGVVRPNENISTIKNKVTGQVKQVYFQDGQSIKQGDLLYTLEAQDLLNQQELTESSLTKEQNKLANLQHLKQLVAEGAITADTTSHSDEPGLLQQQETDANKIKVQIQQTLFQIQTTQQELDQSQKLTLAIQQEKNVFPPNSEYDIKYQDYIMKKKNMEFEKQQTEKKIKENLYSDTQKQLESTLRQSDLSLKQYETDYQMNLQDIIKQDQQKLTSLHFGLDNLYLQLNGEIESGQEQIQQLTSQLKDTKLQLEDRQVQAPISGTVNIIDDISKGDVVASGTEIVTIIPKHNSQYVVQILMQNKDIANIHPDQTIKYNFLALPAKQYGILEGKVSVVSPDASVDQNSGMSYYKIEGSLNNKMVIGKNGQQVQVKVGMVTRASIVLRRERIINYLLGKINLKD